MANYNDDDDIIKYYEEVYEESGKKLDESEKESRNHFLTFVFNLLQLDEYTILVIKGEMVAYLLLFQDWRKRVNNALKKISPLPPRS